MSGNGTLIAVKDPSWLKGFGNLFQNENHHWWGTWQWLIQVYIWMVIVNGMLAMVVLAAPKIETAQTRQAMDEAGVRAARDAIIQERQKGTAAWIFSKPAFQSGN